MQTNIFHLVQKSMVGKLRQNVGLDGRPTGLPGVTAVVVRRQSAVYSAASQPKPKPPFARPRPGFTRPPN